MTRFLGALFAAAILLVHPFAAMAQAPTRLLAIVMDSPTSIPTDATWMQWIRNAVTAVDAFNTEQSYGLASQVTDTVGPYLVDFSPTQGSRSYSEEVWIIAQLGQAAATANGVDLPRYGTNVIYLFPNQGLPIAIGAVGNATGIWIGGAFNRAFPPGRSTLIHEEGHHFGLFWDQEGLDCSDQSPLGGTKGVTCVTLRYWDSIDAQGFGSGQFNAIAKCQKGWIPCPEPVGYGDYLLAPLEHATGTRSLVVDIAKQGFRGQLPITLEYRQPIGSDANLSWVDPANVYHGVVAHMGWQPTLLLRLHPDNPAYNGTKFNAPALAVGEAICFSAARVGLTTLRADANGALVRVFRCH